ncbi:hypothetical protein Pedsa_0392 [Pseudopedobacter saltans DSM 12145]|uniref:DUF4468 domain-containing protein n=1 Tax=Pseudopedobacter saltans (strain ATCC 51119 / DSM 12145 / JCM 21818 / CCUG 39354 / LMG 10337 / NBRC 100064 / NCIMB 13643) TaxID=762903 RepID=F0S557_PSESL|nr:hypothetical protein [Pseudopedobacter saltans]ADY50974.1 hypothetical protein Pedsa_0392 [Pseudopedobacter saltans DSM 12145]
MKVFGSLLFIFFIGLGIANAQTDKSYFLDLPSTNQDTTFEKVLHLLLSSDYFVVSADKSSGLIQCKIVMDDSKVFTKLEVDILEYNLLTRNNQDKGIRIYIQANLKQTIRSVGVNSNRGYTDDNGVAKKPKYYEPLIAFLKSNLI